MNICPNPSRAHILHIILGVISSSIELKLIETYALQFAAAFLIMILAGGIIFFFIHVWRENAISRF
jgi:hypothetical protein